MVKLIIEFIQFLNTAAPLFTSLGVFILLAVLLAKSIKKRATVYYGILAIPCLLVVIPSILRMLGIETYNFNRIPLLGGILRDYIHMGTLGFPLLIIIMYTGALNPQNKYVKRLLSIRKELSIISGFPVLTHSFIRVVNNLPNALKFFTDNDDYLANTKVTNELGAGITNFSFVLGIAMIVLFILLWITSFDSIRKRMGNATWKKTQKWAYVLYAMLFIHAMGLQVGYMLNPRAGRDTAKQVVVEAKASTTTTRDDHTTRPGQQGNSGRERVAQNNRKAERDESNKVQTRDKRENPTQTARPAGSKRVQSKGFADIPLSQPTKRYIHMTSLLLIFGSYLYLRVRKAQKDAAKKRKRV